MVCDVCGSNQVVVEITEISGGGGAGGSGGVRQLKLCEKCAAERGVETGFLAAQLTNLNPSLATSTAPTTPQNQLASFLQTIHQQLASSAGQPTDDVRCSFCSSTIKDFRTTGRLGCAQCYHSFESSLRDILRRVQGSSKHVGRQYEPPSHDVESSGVVIVNVHQIRDRLRRAIEAEEFELAANLRDKLRSLEGNN